jgi:arylsulfatase A-like enzyme
VSTIPRPNIIVFLTDDQGPWALGCAGNSEIRTPNLDALALQGVVFDNLFCTSPVCSPARASLLTGRIPSRHGIHDWLRAGNTVAETDNSGKLIEYLSGIEGYTDLLARAGWECAMSGKWHLGDAHHRQKGFSYWEVHAKGGGPYYGAPMITDGEVYTETRYVTDAITDNALRFLEERRSDRPFYLSVHYTAPHSPWDRDNHPKELYDSYYDHCPFASTPDVDLHPWQNRTAPLGSGPARREVLSGYFAAVTAMDAGVGRVLAYLDESGIRENTLVLFTSDNGMNMGHHGVWGKGNGTFPLNMYDTSVKVPGIVSHPGRVPTGVRVEAMVSHYDVLPTLLEYAGVENTIQEPLPGRSFANLLTDPTGSPARDEVVVYDEYGPVRMIRTAEWKYVHRYPYGPHELYDLARDPEETANLVEEAGQGARVRQMRSRLADWFSIYVDPRRDGARQPVTGFGQIDRVEEGGGGDAAFIQDRDMIRERIGPRS